jgi:hypothetical protein
MSLQHAIEMAQFRAFRLGHHASLCLLDDPALVALAFC